MPEVDKYQSNTVPLLAALAVLAATVTLVAYLPSLSNGFVNFDDPEYVYENIYIRSLGSDFFSWVAGAVVVGNWHPLTMISLALDYAVWGPDPWGYHLSNVLLHSMNTALVTIVAFMLASRGAAGPKGHWPLATGIITGLLFGLHPLHVESVAWISERKDVLSAFFYLLSLIAYLGYCAGRGRRWGWYAVALLAFVLALMSKPMAISLPLVLLIIDFCPLGRFGLGWRTGLARALWEKVPFFALSVCCGVLTIWAQSKGGAMRSVEAISVLGRLGVAIRGYAFYIYKTLVPVKLSPYYPLPGSAERFDIWFFVSLLVLSAITVFCIYMARRRRLFIAVWASYLITLAPVIGFVQVGKQAAADRYMYLPSIGLFLLVGLGAGWLVRSYGKRVLPVLAGVTIVVSGLLAYGTVRQAGIWKDSVTLWTRGVMLYPDRAFLPYAGRGAAFYELGDLSRAIKDFDAAVVLNPGYSKAYMNRGMAYSKVGDLRRAIKDFNAVVVLKPGDSKAYMNRGMAYSKMGDFRRAIKDFNAVVALRPNDSKAYMSRGAAFSRLGALDKALEDLNISIELTPGNPKAYINRGIIHAKAGRILPAIDDFSRAIEHKRDFKEAYYNRALAHEILGRYELAISDLTTALGLDSRYVRAYVNRGDIYTKIGEDGLAVEDFSEAIRLGPFDPDVYRKRGYAYERMGLVEQAAEDLKRSGGLGRSSQERP